MKAIGAIHSKVIKEANLNTALIHLSILLASLHAMGSMSSSKPPPKTSEPHIRE